MLLLKKLENLNFIEIFVLIYDGICLDLHIQINFKF